MMGNLDVAGVAGLNSTTTVNGKEPAVRDLMLGRAQIIAVFLIQKLGILENQINIEIKKRLVKCPVSFLSDRAVN
jgi:hypothetical protein